MDHEDDFGGSVTWDNVSTGAENPTQAAYDSTAPSATPSAPLTSSSTKITVTRPKVELEGTKDTFVSYLVSYEVSVPVQPREHTVCTALTLLLGGRVANTMDQTREDDFRIFVF